jgi:hypothetical protein
LPTEKNRALRQISDRLEKLDEKFMNDEIEGSTYKKWFRKYSADCAILQEDVKDLKSDQSSKWLRLIDLFPYLEDLLSLFDRADIRQMHSLFKSWFKHTLRFNGEVFETAWLNPAFEANYLILKEKGLLLIEQSRQKFGETPVCTQVGVFLNHWRSCWSLFMRLQKMTSYNQLLFVFDKIMNLGIMSISAAGFNMGDPQYSSFQSLFLGHEILQNAKRGFNHQNNLLTAVYKYNINCTISTKIISILN